MTNAQIETRIVNATVRLALANGYTVSVFDGEEYTVKRSSSFREITKAMGTTDEDRIVIRHNGEHIGSITFVYGNGADVLADCSTSLEAFLEPINELIDKLSLAYA